MGLNYNQEKEFLKRVEDVENKTNLRQIPTEEKIQQILSEHPSLPQDYIQYLQEIGSGNFRECQFNVKDYLFDIESIGLGEDYDIKPNVKFFGDNFCGDFSGFDFDNNDGFVVEFWHETGQLYYTGQTFKNYIRQQMLMDMDGNDIRMK
jgi:hypothetical protein